MQVILDITSADKDIDPLTTINVNFSRQDWVLAFQYSIATVSGDQSPAIEEIRQLFIFRNETKNRLSVIRVPAYQLDGPISEFEGFARAISSNLVDSGLVNFRGQFPAVSNDDSDELLHKLGGLVEYYKQAGTEVGYFYSKDGKLLSDKNRSDQFKLANDTVWTIGAISGGVEPNDAVAVALRVKFEAPVSVGQADHFGVLMSYPTRIFYLAIQNRSSIFRIDPNTAGVAVTDRNNGAISRPDASSLRKVSPAAFIFADRMLDRDSKVQLRWVWGKSANAN